MGNLFRRLRRGLTMLWCCCKSAPAITPYWYYGGRTAYYDQGSNTWAGTAHPINVYSGTIISPVYRLFTPPYTIYPALKPFGIVIFPILANPGQTINSATFHLRLWNTYVTHGDYHGTFRARTTVSTGPEVNPTSVATWDTVRAWTTDAPVSFAISVLPDLGYDCAEFDVTARVQAMVNQAGFQRGGCFAAIVEATDPDDTEAPFDPLQTVGNGSQASGAWNAAWPAPAVSPHPATGAFSYQCYLVLT